MFEIIPGILEKDWESIERKIELVRPFAKTIHIDILDGKFAPNTTFLDPKPFTKYKSEIFFELHMMVEEPINYLKPWAEAGIKRFIGHVEKMSDQKEFVAEGQLLGEVGLAIDGPTSINSIKVPLDDLDYILIMTVKAGFSGQTFTPEYLEKVKTLRQAIRPELRPRAQGRQIPIEVDGGINDSTIVQARNAGANRFLATSFIFKADPFSQYKILENAIMDLGWESRLGEECS